MSDITREDICNKALALLKQTTTITDLGTDTGFVANLCNLHIDLAIDVVTERSYWNFLIVRTSPTLASSSYSTEFTYSYLLPSSPIYCLTLIEVFDEYGKEIDEWRVEGRYIVCNVENIEIRFVKRITNLNECPSLFLNALVFYVASLLAEPLTHNEGIVGRMLRNSEYWIKKAISHDGQQTKLQYDTDPDDFEWITSRNS